MAEDLVLSAISNLTSLYNDEVTLFESVNTERKKLQSKLSVIKSVLEDAEKKQLANSSTVLKNWLQKLHDAVYELDDILDDCSLEDIRDEYEGDKSCAFLGFIHPRKVMFRRSIINRMKAISENLDVIAQEKDRFNFLPAESQADHPNPRNIPQWRQTTSFVSEYEIFGREQDKKTIVCHLLEGASHADTVCHLLEGASHADTLISYPIIGIGGLGKTALAQLVYNDERVKRHFEIKKWICVSDNFDLNTLLKGMSKSNKSPSKGDELVKELQDMLKGKRYLIVLDDVWNDNPDKWNQLRSILACGAKGSAVLITTRLEKVAMMMRTPSAQPYRLTALSEEDCWKVFRKCAFGSCIVQETQNLVSIGKDIAKKCKGVPLAAKTLGGLLMFTADERFWIKIRDSDIWNLSKEEDSIFAALRLSYLNLSPRARRCFSFCSIFPKDYRIRKMDLIHLWMANDLICEGPSTTLELEDMGEEMVNDLYWRSLIQDVDRDHYFESIISFKMHDLVHDLAQSISSQETDVLEGLSSAKLSPSTRHISIDFYGRIESGNICHLLEKFQSIRSLVFLRCNDPVSLVISNSLKHTRLRALDWSASSITYVLQVLPSSIDVLKHLRYLNLSCSFITKLPFSIGCLWNLQTLKVKNCRYLKTFPVSIGRLKNLRHLYNGDCQSLSIMPQSMAGLTSLRTLNLVVMGEPEKRDQLQLSGLEHLNYLRGELEIKHLKRVRHVEDVEKANLIGKQDLDYLALEWSDEVGGAGDDIDQHEQIQVLEALRPPPRLRQLKLIGYEGIRFSNWMMNEMGIFTCMQSLELKLCKSCTQLPPMWKLPSLKKLVLDSLDGIRYLIESREVSFGEGFVFFPALEVLGLYSLPVMEKIISGKEINKKNCIIFPRLSELAIGKCEKFNSFNSGVFPSLKKLELDSLPNMRYLIENSKGSCGEECVYFPSLEELDIRRLLMLEKIIFAEKADQELSNKNFIIFPRLSRLLMEYCPKLNSLNSDAFPSLKKLELLDLYSLRYLIENNQDSCGEDSVYFPLLDVLIIRFLPTLETIVARGKADQELNNKNGIIFRRLSLLVIDHCIQLKSVSSSVFPSLKTLKLSDLFSLRYLIENNQDHVYFPLLNVLDIESLPRLEKIVAREEAVEELNKTNSTIFPSLRSLKLSRWENTPSLRLRPLQESKGTESSLGQRISDVSKRADLLSVVLQLTSLRRLSLENFAMKSLDTDILTNIPSLKRLVLVGGTNLESLPNWMDRLASLEGLTIWSCKRLTTLPDSIRQLSKLKMLRIVDCPALDQRCSKETGQDWHKIAHIPEIITI